MCFAGHCLPAGVQEDIRIRGVSLEEFQIVSHLYVDGLSDLLEQAQVAGRGIRNYQKL